MNFSFHTVICKYLLLNPTWQIIRIRTFLQRCVCFIMISQNKEKEWNGCYYQCQTAGKGQENYWENKSGENLTLA